MRDKPEHMKQLADLGIETIDIVAINLYPFKETILKPGVTPVSYTHLDVYKRQPHIRTLEKKSSLPARLSMSTSRDRIAGLTESAYIPQGANVEKSWRGNGRFRRIW